MSGRATHWCADPGYNAPVKRSEAAFGLLRIPVDALAVLAALLAAYRLRAGNIDLIPRIQLLEPAQTLPPPEAYLRAFAVPGVGIFLCIAALLGLYVLRSTHGGWNEVGRILVSALVWLVAIMGWYFLLRKQLFYSRVLLVHSAFFIVILVSFGRAAVTVLQRAFLRIGIGNHRVVSVGRIPVAASARDVLLRDIRYRYLGHAADLAELVRVRRHVDLVLQTDAHAESADTLALIDHCRSRHIGYAFLPPVLADHPHQLQIERLGLVPMVRFRPTPLDGWGKILKRLFDILASFTLLVVLSPVIFLIGLWIAMRDGWPVFYVSTRVGEKNRCTIPVLKFRTMVRDADRQKACLRAESHRADGPLFKMKGDPRVLRSGRILRSWSLDELPQILNVLAGQMSLVGPRPHLPEEVRKYSNLQRRVFAVKPGITGLAQVSGRSDLEFEEEVRLDLQYIEEWSLALDLWILWRTVFVVFRGEGAD